MSSERNRAARIALLSAAALAAAAVSAWPATTLPLGWLRVALLLLLPGLAVLLWLQPLEHANALQILSLAPLISLALLPTLLFWVGLAGGAWNAGYVRLLLVLCSLLVFIRLLGRTPHAGRGSGDARPLAQGTPQQRRASWAAGAALGLLFAIALGVRLYMIRDVLYPAWVDSYQHTIITQIILNTGRVPANYYPYADLDTFVYHFGFHAWSAFVAWLTGLPAHRAVLWGGQVLNALTVPSLFLIVDRLALDRRAALIAAAVGGLFSRMPAFYVNWGRYPQLAGQVLLPAAIVLSVEAVSARGDAAERPRGRWRSLLAAGVVVGGLGFTHYRVAIFYLAAMVVLLLAEWFGGRRSVRAGRCAGAALGRLVAVGGIALLVMAPWLPAFVGKTVSTAQQVLATSQGTQYDYITLDFVLGYGLRPSLLIATLVAALWALVRARRRPLGLAVLAWLALMVFLSNPLVSGLPSGFLPNGTLIVALYLPAALLIGLAVGDAFSLLEARIKGPRLRNGLRAAYALLLAAIACWGGYWLARTCIDPWRYLVSQADVQAMAWVEANTPADATFAVGGDFALESGVSGHDAGLWLPYSAHRRTLVPPLIYVSEGDPGYVSQTTSELSALYRADSPEALARTLHELGADYVYQSNRTPQAWQAFLEDSARFERLYDRGGVRVYRVLD